MARQPRFFGERYLLTCMRYIEMNPVRAGMVGRGNEIKLSQQQHLRYEAQTAGAANESAVIEAD